MKRFVFAPLLVLVLGAMAFVAPAAAQDATPVVPDAALCTLTPPTYDELSAYAASPAAEALPSPEATPTFGLPAGEPVDDATRQAVIDSMTINVACLNTGSTLLTMAAYTDAALERLVAGAGAISQEFYDSLATPEPIPADQATVIIEFQDMVKLPDGSIAAIIVGDNQGDDTEAAGPTLFYLAEQDGHWYIDDFVNPSDE
jgi:hypothetical protein